MKAVGIASARVSQYETRRLKYIRIQPATKKTAVLASCQILRFGSGRRQLASLALQEVPSGDGAVTDVMVPSFYRTSEFAATGQRSNTSAHSWAAHSRCFRFSSSATCTSGMSGLSASSTSNTKAASP